MGITANLPARLRTHRREKPWWAEVVRMDVEWHPDREAAEVAEQLAISTESPRWNIQHNGGAPRMTSDNSSGRRDRLSFVTKTEFRPDSLVGSFFHSDAERGWQGCVVAEPHPGYYLVETFSWLLGDSYAQLLVHIDQMNGWQFYDDAEWMNGMYGDGVNGEWRAHREARGLPGVPAR